MHEMMVSIICNTYNHEKYIEKTLKSFMMQQTTFAFEVLVYDDASTDSTANIIKKYQELYPDIIKPILMTENQYSLGKRPGEQNRNRATGKYIALCEGDDYWIDPLKLQKQIDYMETHEKCTFCFTNGFLETNGKQKKNIIPWESSNKKIYRNHTKDFDCFGLLELGYIPTASFVMRTKIYKERPIFNENCFTGDLYMALTTTINGYAHFIDENTCVYRYGVSGSETTRWRTESKEKYLSVIEKYINLLEAMNEYTNNCYAQKWSYYSWYYKIQRAVALHDRKVLRIRGCRKYIHSKGILYWVKVLLKIYII